MSGDLTKGYSANIAAPLQLTDVFRETFFQSQVAIANRSSQQRSLENFAQRSQVEQRIRRNGLFIATIRPTIIEERGMSAQSQNNGHAASASRRHDRMISSSKGPAQGRPTVKAMTSTTIRNRMHPRPK